MVVLNDFLSDARVTKEAETLTNARYEVTVLALHYPRRTQKLEIHKSGFSIQRISAYGLFGESAEAIGQSASFTRLMLKIWNYLFVYSRLLVELIKRRQSDVFHAHDINALVPVWIIGKIFRIPIVYDSHEINSDRAGLKAVSGVVRFIERITLPSVDAMMTTTDLRSDHFESEFKIMRPQVIQNRPRFRPPLKSDLIKRALDIRDDRPIVLYQGRLHEGRGVRNLLAVAGNIPDAHFVFIGSGPQESLIDRNITIARSKNVHRIPWVPLEDLHSYTSSAHIGIQLLRNTCKNHYTTDSNKLFEYIMAGLPVVASSFPEIERIVKQHQIGYTCDPDDLADIINVIQTLVGDHCKRAKLAANAEAAAKTLCWESQENILLNNVYGNLSLDVPERAF